MTYRGVYNSVVLCSVCWVEGKGFGVCNQEISQAINEHIDLLLLS